MDKKGSLYRNLMMPGFTDAGAGTAYVPTTVISRRTAATPTVSNNATASVMASSNATDSTNSDNNQDVDVDAHAEDTFSEAATELHDNRTDKSTTNSLANRDRYYLLKSRVVQENGKAERGRDDNANTTATTANKKNGMSGDSIEVEATFGFFPSTKPPPSPSPRGIGIDNTEKYMKSPNGGKRNPNIPQSPSPQPVSPPPVTRKQLVAASGSRDPQKVQSEGSSSINKNNSNRIGNTDGNVPKEAVATKNETSPKDEHDAEQDLAKTQQLPLHKRNFAMQREVSTFSLAPETGAVVEREENQAKLKDWKERKTLNDSRNTDRRLDLNALQEIDRMENQKNIEGVKSFGNLVYNGKAKKENDTSNVRADDGDEDLSISSSIVSSTCSEFGTVIQMGDAAMAARMKEVEEMEKAALAEAGSEEFDTEHQTKVSQLSTTSLLKHDNSLDLPILEVPSSDEKLDATAEPARLETGSKFKASKTGYDAKTTVATANSTISPRKRNPTKSEMVSAAFRRIGPLHSLNNNTTMRGDKKIRNSLSAPTTPMRIQPPNQSKQSSEMSAGGLESSPTRYETGSDIVGDKKTRILSPRFASFLRGRGNGATASSMAKTKTSTEGKASLHPNPLSPREAISQSFQYAQKCFSKDIALTEYSANDYDCDTDRKLQEDLAIPPLGQRPTTARLAPRVLPLDSSSSIRNNRRLGNSNGPLRYSYSLDYSSDRRSPFRELPYSTSRRYPFMNHSFPAPTNEASATIPNLASADINLRGRINSDFSPTKHSKKTLALNSTMELQQPQRIEIEREDALDILACLVEQGIADWNSSTKTQNNDEDDKNLVENSSEPPLATPSSDIMKTAKEEKTEEGVSRIPPASIQKDLNDTMKHDHYDSDSALQELVDEFKKWIENHEENNPSAENGTNNRCQRKRRTELLRELVKSHAYAMDMKRASASASTWLKSIGRGQDTGNLTIVRESEETQELKSSEISTDTTEGKNSKKDKSDTTDKMDTLTLRAMFHSAQLELAETKQLNVMLNEELSKCRAEIGRMKSISRSGHINKSILDNSEISSDTSGSREGQSKDTPNSDPKYEHFVQRVPSKEARESTGESDVNALKDALNKANETIRRLHRDLHKGDIAEDDEEIDAAPVVDIPEIKFNERQPRSTSSTPDSTRRTVNVRMLDGENFVTEWDELRSLPPPPDHSLQSPIVSAILEQWTQDNSLHESLLSWMDNVMKSNDLEDLPPLTISSLNHQVRDGFTMHVLPHLLRRADIHVGVKTRTHRQTTYDMSVTVSQKKEFMMGASNVISSSRGHLQPHDVNSQQQMSLMDRRDSMSGDEWANQFEPRLSSSESVAHSAVTETIANLPGTAQNQRGITSEPWDQTPQTPVQTEYSEFSSQLRSRSGSVDSYDESSQHYRQRPNEHNQGSANNGTIMGALGGALSGLLSRNKYAVSPGRFYPSHAQLRVTGSAEDGRGNSNMLPASLRAQMDLTSSPTPGSTGYHRMGQLENTVSAGINDQRQHHQEDLQPYHRVVSAPPGRIGVTFVEFRGHAMVSDVALDSPLAGWVFPSDILIAVDEIPVSGMRVRDIVTILSDRKNRQRAMRVISSHAMNEFTMMSQVGGPLNDESAAGE